MTLGVGSFLRSPATLRLPTTGISRFLPGVCHQDEAAQKSEVLQEVHPLLLATIIVGLLPEAMARVGRRNKRTDERQSGKTLQLAYCKQGTGSYLDGTVELYECLCVGSDRRNRPGERPDHSFGCFHL